ncbi:carotenoid biosynthesis protein [Jeotgalibacillus proteolyticus]|uniref:Carotenoid biosynthesis protein n=1 Tax=Jeotgalibacillus proteolyticus TaxID=2082395 RepID=A0A2S5GFR7_9BACL|nr:carotenoid biosynthesis protein [Jeotgalibacillus proteolyticus]
MVGFDILPPFLEWANAVFLYLAGALAIIYAVQILGKRAGLLFSAIITAFTMWAESLGVKYGWVFGAYHYEKDFGVQVFGVPLTIGFAWVMVIFTSMAIARAWLTHSFSFGRWIGYALITSMLAVCMDLIIDPVAFVAKEYWVWENTGPYYGIPNQNFIGWFSVSFGIQLLLYLWITFRNTSYSSLWNRRMKWLYGMMIGMFVVTSLVAGLFTAVFVTGSALAVTFLLQWAGRRFLINESQ